MTVNLSKLPAFTFDPKSRAIYVRQVVEGYAKAERSFGAMTALVEYGRHFEKVQSCPEWLAMGKMGECFATCTRALMPYIADKEPPYSYAEGYALDPEYGIPFEHAWLVDTDGEVVDLTWNDSEHATYYGVTFKAEFVLQTMRESKYFGILSNQQIQSRLYKNRAAFENSIWYPTILCMHATDAF